MRLLPFLTLLGAALLSSCAGSDRGLEISAPNLQAADTNVILVVTPDLTHNAGDINPKTANLSNQGLQRALMLAKYLKTELLRSATPDALYALEPCTRLQTARDIPDMVPLEIMEQFALLNQSTLVQAPPAQNVVANSFPIKVSYSPASLPVIAATPSAFYPTCQGIDFADRGDGNEALVDGILAQQRGGFHLLAMPFETLQTLLAKLKASHAYAYTVPATWEGPNVHYALTVPSGSNAATLNRYDAKLEPGHTYPSPNVPYQPANNLQTPFVIQPSTLSGSSLPGGLNSNQTVYFIRHGEAHPASQFEDGNLVMPGNWRALYLPAALEGKISPPDYVYTVDPAQAFPGMNNTTNSYIRPSMTVAPYAIAKGMPLYLASSFRVGGLSATDDAAQVQAAINFFFTGGQFSGKTMLVAWEHVHIQEIAQALVNRYFSDPTQAPTVPPWPGDSPDYDTVWTFTLDGRGNLTLSNKTCEGIESTPLPSTAPTF